MPEPSPWLVRIRTPEGPTCLTTWTNCCCRARADGAAAAGGEAGDDELGELPAPGLEQPARTSAASTASAAVTSMGGAGGRGRSGVVARGERGGGAATPRRAPRTSSPQLRRVNRWIWAGVTSGARPT